MGHVSRFQFQERFDYISITILYICMHVIIIMPGRMVVCMTEHSLSYSSIFAKCKFYKRRVEPYPS